MVAGVGAVSPFAFVRDANATGDLALRRYLQRQVDIIKTPGIAAAVVRGDQVVWSAGAGWADIERGIPTTRDTVFQLASVSKTVTCAGIMTLVEDGVLDLDADVNRYLPFEVHVPAAPDVPITMRTLLTHTSAIRDRWQIWGTPTSDPTLYFHGDSPIPLGAFCRSYFAVDGSEYRPNQNFFQREPGTAYTYSNLAVALAGYVAESASGVDFDALVQRPHPRSAGHDRFRVPVGGHRHDRPRDAVQRQRGRSSRTTSTAIPTTRTARCGRAPCTSHGGSGRS